MPDNSRGSTAMEPTEFTPDWAVSPGELLQIELKSRGLTQSELAQRTSLSAKHVNQVIKGVVNLSPEVAVALERTLDISAEFWLKTEASWRAARTRETVRANLMKFQEWLAKFPTRALLKNAVIDVADNTETQIDRVLRFFRVTDPAAFDKVWLQPQASFKRSQHFFIDHYATALWIRLVESQAEAEIQGRVPYSPKMLRKILPELPRVTRNDMPDAFADARHLLRQAGVLLVYMPEIPDTRICAMTRWLPTGNPVIGLTNRNKRIDSFWFYLAHEIGHVLLHPGRATYIDLHENSVDDDKDEQESAANTFAAELYIPRHARARLKGLQIPELADFAREMDVAIDIVAGQYGHLHRKWSAVSRFRRSVDLDDVLSEYRTQAD